MFKLVAVFAIIIAAANAGVIGHGAAVAVAPVSHASSYANSNLVAVHPVAVTVAHSAPVVHAAPVAVAHAVPAVAVGVAHGGFAGHGYGHGHGGYYH